MAKRKKKNLPQKYDEAESREKMFKILKTPQDPEVFFKKLGKELLPVLLNEDKEKRSKALDDMSQEMDWAMLAMGLKNHYPVMETVDERYRPWILELTRKIEKEFECQTSLEKTLAQSIAIAHAKFIRYSRRLSGCLDDMQVTANKNGFYNFLSKEIDRSHRQFITALTTLRSLKSPIMDIDVKVNTLFFGQNQHINSEIKPNNKNNDQQ